jgi:hypothetical protein
MNHKAAQYLDLLSNHYLVETFVDVPGCAGFPHGLPRITRIDIGLNLPVQVDPLTVDDNGITAGLSFGRRPHVVLIPWSALLGVRASGVEYMHSTTPRPDLALTAVRPELPPPPPPAPRAHPAHARPALRLIKGGAA